MHMRGRFVSSKEKAWNFLVHQEVSGFVVLCPNVLAHYLEDLTAQGAERICKNMLYSIVGIGYHKNRAVSTWTCRGKAPPSCYARPFCRLKAPLGLSLLRCASQTRTFENTSLSAVCKKKQWKLWQKERGLDGASPLDKEKYKALYYNKAIRT